jgi:hypothetical protein
MKYTLALLLGAIFSFGTFTNAGATTIVIGESHHHHHHHHWHHRR